MQEGASKIPLTHTTEFLPKVKVHFTFAIQCYSHICQMVSTPATQKHLAATRPSKMNRIFYVPYWDKFHEMCSTLELIQLNPEKNGVASCFFKH